MKNPLLTRRNAVLTGLFGSGYVGLKALATGLPAWFIANPSKATAQDLECAIAAQENLQYLIVSVSSMGDPISCNCPGTYAGGAPGDNASAAAAVHPDDATMAPTPVTLGGQTYTAAAPWATLGVTSTDTTGEATRARTAFFHHVTLANNHGDQPKVMRLMGATTGGEMLVSAYAKHLAGCFGTVQKEPVAVGARGNASELVSFAGRSLPSISPTQLRQLLTGSSGGFQGGGGPGRQNPAAVLVNLRQLRDTYLDQLNELAKNGPGSTEVQRKFLDALAMSQQQVRLLKENLGATLDAIDGDGVADQALAAAALIAAKVSPVITVRIPFGGDNHSDANLAAEVADHTDANGNGAGVAGINAMLDALQGMGIADQVTFATLNVFGRNLNGISKTDSKSGRDHYGNHSVAVIIGKNVKGGVYGGVTNVSGGFGSSGEALGASDIDSASGASVASGGDVPRGETHVSMARTLGAALGIPQAELDKSFVLGSGGKAVPAALVNPPT
jgi:hypothetical protein